MGRKFRVKNIDYNEENDLSSDGESAKGNFRGRWFESNSSLSLFFCLKVKEDISNEDSNKDNYFFKKDQFRVDT